MKNAEKSEKLYVVFVLYTYITIPPLPSNTIQHPPPPFHPPSSNPPPQNQQQAHYHHLQTPNPQEKRTKTSTFPTHLTSPQTIKSTSSSTTTTPTSQTPKLTKPKNHQPPTPQVLSISTTSPKRRKRCTVYQASTQNDI